VKGNWIAGNGENGVGRMMIELSFQQLAEKLPAVVQKWTHTPEH
jgi:hypothetical protein